MCTHLKGVTDMERTTEWGNPQIIARLQELELQAQKEKEEQARFDAKWS